MADKFVDDLLGPIEPEPTQEELPIGQTDERSGSEEGPPAIQPIAVDENAEMPLAAYENDSKDLVVESPNTPESTGADVSSSEESGVPPVPGAPVSETPKPSREVGLRNEIVRLRAELKKGEVLSPPIVQPPVLPAPVAYPSPQSGAGEPPKPNVPGAQVVVSEDGEAVYLPDDEINRRVDERVRAAMQPSPQQQAMMASSNMEQEFMASDPERNPAALQKFRDVDEYLGLKLQGLQAQGYRPQSVPDLIQAMRVTGVEQEFASYFPETAPMFDELIAAVSSQQPAWKRSILDRIAASSSPPESVPLQDGGPVPPKPLIPVTNMPKSLARKGGVRSQAPDADNSEFKKLEDGFHADPVGFPPAKYKRYQELGRKLKEDGFESI